MLTNQVGKFVHTVGQFAGAWPREYIITLLLCCYSTSNFCQKSLFDCYCPDLWKM